MKTEIVRKSALCCVASERPMRWDSSCMARGTGGCKEIRDRALRTENRLVERDKTPAQIRVECCARQASDRWGCARDAVPACRDARYFVLRIALSRALLRAEATTRRRMGASAGFKDRTASHEPGFFGHLRPYGHDAARRLRSGRSQSRCRRAKPALLLHADIARPAGLESHERSRPYGRLRPGTAGPG
jgi:hypothetical protein